MTTPIQQTDRITYSFSMKVPGPEQYSSVNVSVSLSTDVRAGETADQAIERARALVQAQCERDLPGAGPPSVDDQLFDAANPVHWRIADAIFDQVKVQSAERRQFLVNRFCVGQRVGDIGAIIRNEVEAFNNRARGGGQPLAVGRRDGTKSNWNGRWPRKG